VDHAPTAIIGSPYTSRHDKARERNVRFTSTPVVRFAQIAVIARRRGEWGKSTQSGSPAIRRREHAPKSPISDREPGAPAHSQSDSRAVIATRSTSRAAVPPKQRSLVDCIGTRQIEVRPAQEERRVRDLAPPPTRGRLHPAGRPAAVSAAASASSRARSRRNWVLSQPATVNVGRRAKNRSAVWRARLGRFVCW
jgi:hypothetical protein